MLALAGLALFGCKKDPEPFVIRVTAGLDGAPFEGSPAVVDVDVRVRALDGAERSVARTAVTAGSIEVPDAAKSGIGSLVLAGLSSPGSVAAYGRTPPLELAGLAGTPTVSLAILVQRVGTVARAFKLHDKTTRPICTVVGARFLVVSDASTPRVQVIDLLDLSVRRENGWPTAPVTVAASGAFALSIDASGAGTLVDFSTRTSKTATPPSGVAFGDVSGGATILADDGSTFVVGATRDGAPTDAVLRIDRDGALSVRRLSKARRRAAAAWVPGRGLVVAYGEGASGDATSVEVIAPGGTVAAPLPYPAKNERGGLLVPLEGGRVLRFREDGTAATIDLGCASSCSEADVSLRDDVASTRADDVVVALETGASVMVRAGRVHLLSPTGDASKLLHDGKTAVCAASLPIGSAGVVFAEDDVVRTVAPERL